MLSFIMIGIDITAGLCNRLFQMVFAYAISKTYHIPFRFERWQQHSHHTTQVYEWLIQRFQETPLYSTAPVQYNSEWSEPYNSFATYLDVATLIPQFSSTSIHIHGFFQNEKYFKEHREDILYLLREPDYVTDYITTKYPSNRFMFESSYFLHVRLGDYLYMGKHFIHLENYYEEAIKTICMNDPNPIIYIFSNQPNVIEKVYPKLYANLIKHNVQYTILSEPDEIITFYLMIRCMKGGVCSNSTYGWWASWLNTNPQKRVFMPSKWVNEDIPIDIYPDYATILEV